jgi:hypothetical protein
MARPEHTIAGIILATNLDAKVYPRSVTGRFNRWRRSGMVRMHARKRSMMRPVGKYNVWNKTHLSEGTSH